MCFRSNFWKCVFKSLSVQVEHTWKYPEIGGGHGRDGSDTDEQESEESRTEKIMFNFYF